MSLLQIEGLNITFAGLSAEKCVVEDLSLTIHAGEKFALVGESGSGKTVSALAVLRLVQAQLSGRICFNQEALLQCSEARMRSIRGAEIAMIFQEPMSALNPLYTIGNQIVEVLSLHLGLNEADAMRQAIELLAQTGIPEPAQRFHSYPHELSGGQRQRAMIAMALACKPKLLIADEPTTALDVTLRGQIMQLLENLQQQYGMAIWLITHDLNLVQRFADRVGVMQDGQLIELEKTDTLFSNPQHHYTQRLLNSRPQRIAPPAPNTNEAPVIAGAGLCVEFTTKQQESRGLGWFDPRQWFAPAVRFRAINDVSIEVAPAETVGVVGESGSGKSTLAMALLALQPITAGNVYLQQQPLHQLKAHQLRQLRGRMQVVFQDPFASLSPRMTIEQIVGEGLALHAPELSIAQRRVRIIEMLEEVGLSEAILARYPHEFSGGQRQRIAIARAVILKPQLLVLDEPTSALDVSIQKQVLELLVNLQTRYQMSYLFISHDLAVIRALAHRVVVMKNGRVVEANSVEKIFESPQSEYTRDLITASF